MRGIIYWTNSDNQERAEKLFEQTISNYELIGIKAIKITRLRFKSYVEFENGDMWQCHTPRGDLRGVKANITYIPYGTEGHQLETAISTAVAQPYHGVIYY